MRRLIVLEINELPRRVVDWWIEQAPDGGLARLLDRGTFTETVLDEELPRDLYPSQSWASVGTGVPWVDHGVFWYGDPKPARYPFYWQAAAAAGRSVGLVGVLHSSPLELQAADPNIRFLVPDAFAGDADTRPDDLRPLQELNLRASRRSARVASVRPSFADAAALRSVRTAGLTPSTASRLAGLAGSVAVGRVGRERLRAGQTMLLGDVFRAQIRRFDPDLAVTFTNHVAAAMHRYWAATFPEDYPEPPYDEAWRERHRDELPFAMRMLDREIDLTLELADATDREVVLVSSMGQKADVELRTDQTHQAVVRDGAAFLRALGIEDTSPVNAAMVPQLTVTTDSSDDADRLESALRERLGPSAKEIMVSDHVVTATYDIEVIADGAAESAARILLGRRSVDAFDAGVTVEPITDHRSGRHSPFGVLVTDRSTGLADRVDAFEFAPWLLGRLGVEPLAHHRPVTNVVELGS